MFTVSRLPRHLSFCTQPCRFYALSRFPHRATGFGRSSRANPSRGARPDSSSEDYSSGHEEPSVEREKGINATTDPRAGLERLLANNDELVITRQLEMLNIFMGFEQSNRYVIANPDGESLGYVVEEPRGVLSMFARQLFRTHRPFRALVLNLEGSPILWIRRPFSWINSRMFVQRPKDRLGYGREGEPVLDTFAEVQQEWHLWRRRYNLFLRSTQRVLTPLGSDPQPESLVRENHFSQFARVDEGLWAWYFVLRNAQGEGIATVNRAFRGFGREIFTDTGQYNVSFRAPDEMVHSSGHDNGPILHRPSMGRSLTIDERALVLATAINVDYDYFSRHSEGGHGFTFWHSGE